MEINLFYGDQRTKINLLINAQSEHYEFFLCDFLMWENLPTHFKFGPKIFQTFNFRTQFCPKIKRPKFFEVNVP